MPAQRTMPGYLPSPLSSLGFDSKDRCFSNHPAQPPYRRNTCEILPPKGCRGKPQIHQTIEKLAKYEEAPPVKLIAESPHRAGHQRMEHVEGKIGKDHVRGFNIHVLCPKQQELIGGIPPRQNGMRCRSTLSVSGETPSIQRRGEPLFPPSPVSPNERKRAAAHRMPRVYRQTKERFQISRVCS